MENDQNCLLVGDFEGDSRLWVTFDYGLDRSRIVVTSKAFKSADANKRYKLDLLFVRGGQLDDGWGEVNAEGLKIDDNGGVAFTLRSADALKDLSSSSILALSLDGNVIASLSLKQSAPAVEALRMCAKKVNARNPSDPLAGAELPSSDQK